MKISLILPAHNEEENLRILVPKVLERYRKFFNEIIIVNDSSTDSTRKVAEGLAKKYHGKIKLVNRHPPNGVGYAIRDGIKNVSKSSEWVMTMDSDFLHNIGDIQKFIDKVNEGYDGATGSRFISRNSLINYPLTKKIANRAYHALLWLLLGLKQKDVTNNFKLYRKKVFDDIELKAGNFAVNAETGLIPIMKGYRIAEVPVIWKERDHGKSKFAVFKLGPSYLKVFFRLFKQRLIK